MTIDRLDAMRTFVEIVDAGSFSAAARRMGVSVPAISRRLAGFEERLGTLLMHRTTRSQELTEYGRSYYEKAKRILSDVDDAELSLEGIRTSPSGVLRVAAPNVFGRKFVAPLMPEFLGLYPRLRVNLSLVGGPAGNGTETNGNSDVDASIHLCMPAPQKDMESRSLGSFRHVLCASPRYVERLGAPKCPEDLARHDCIFEATAGRATSWPFRRRGRDMALPVDGRLVCDDADAVLNAALAGSGVARVPSFQVRDHVRERRLEILLEDFEPPATQTRIAYSKQGAASPKIAAFVRFLADSIPQEQLDL
ncbi:MAG: LysR family transcriptional regulator [Alphaproteobacteria bacterium]|nr:LysR family transcriptional regulator [Alphaproteobacteria bacterium]